MCSVLRLASVVCRFSLVEVGVLSYLGMTVVVTSRRRKMRLGRVVWGSSSSTSLFAMTNVRSVS